MEVKGSVELAPLTGLAEGIVDLTATGTTLRENGLVVREEILASTARLIANPVAHKLARRRARRPRDAHAGGAGAMVERLAVVAEDAAGVAADVRGLVPAPASVARGRWPGSSPRSREGGDDALLMHERRFGGVDGPIRVPGEELAAALEALDAEVRAGLELALRERPRGRRGGPGRGPRRRAARRARSCGCARSRSRAPRSTRPAAASRTRPRS